MRVRPAARVRPWRRLGFCELGPDARRVRGLMSGPDARFEGEPPLPERQDRPLEVVEGGSDPTVRVHRLPDRDQDAALGRDERLSDFVTLGHDLSPARS